MKAVSGSVCTSARTGSGSSPSSALHECSVQAGDRAGKHRLEKGDEEMQACFARLMQLVPTIPPNGKMSKVQLLQHVIDYILDLEYTLDLPPSESSFHQTDAIGEAGDAKRAAGGSVGSGVSWVPSSSTGATSSPSQQTIDRKPLTENVQVNNSGQNSTHQTASSVRQPSITWS